MKIEDITGVGLTSRGTAEQEGHLTVGNGLLGKIIVDDQGVLAVVTEPEILMLAWVRLTLFKMLARPSSKPSSAYLALAPSRRFWRQ